MVKVITNEFSVCCEDCDVELFYEDEDLDYGEYGCAYITCPNCGAKVWTYRGDKLLEPNEIEYPKHFFRVKLSGKPHISDVDIQSQVRQIAAELITSDREILLSEHHGVVLLGFVEDAQTRVIVAKDYEDIIIQNNKGDEAIGG